MNAFLTYIVLGISLSAPVGPINAAQLEKGVRFGFLHAWLVGVGAMFADLFYMLLIYFGVAHFLDTPFMKTFLWLFGCFVLLYTGIVTLKSLKIRESSEMRESPSEMSSFRSGFFMALTSPLTILFWLGIYGSILAQSSQSHSAGQALWHSLGIFVGIMVWDVSMALIASSFHRFGNRLILQITSLLAGISLIMFGLYFGYQALLMLAG
ncbi:LysE family transporter [Paenibacillus sp. UNC499MF]|uniref:LysE family transporter n=1 Tax=Paenibacillus sp. UNC499MF TaxID=1502751 RepID=UPI0008A01CCE|nr:LysE family transporter [Paenibacillus sp. UNC499MF]SEG64143.1 Threonine/homoserine/homoserine lactone efflux protein [Paenibacillus sp. UNC499MF]